MMNKPTGWLEKFNNGFLHEKIIFFSLSFILCVLSFDCWFQNLPFSGYGFIFIILILIGCTTWATCHGIKWLILRNKPLQFYIAEESKNEKWLKFLKFIQEKENIIFDRIFENKNDRFDSFKYPTTLNEQTRLFLKDIEKDFIKSWYTDISQNPSFLFDTHLLLEEILFKIIERLKNINSKNLIINILILYLNHLQEYKKSLKKILKVKNSDCDSEKCDGSNCEPKHKKLELIDVYRCSHPGSQNDVILNYYLTKVTKCILQEYAPHEFVTSLQCKILKGIIARKVLRGLLTTIEDPNWINIKLIYLFDVDKCEELLKNGRYVVKERIVVENEEENGFLLKSKPTLLGKRYLLSDLFQNNKNLFTLANSNGTVKSTAEVKDSNENIPVKNVSTEKESLTLPLYNNAMRENSGSNISTVLGGLISSTAGPLLPDNVSLCYHPINKMWQSPVVETKKELPDGLSNPFGKTIVEGVKISKERVKNKGLSRSKSTDAMSPNGEINEFLKLKDVSVAEELCESVRFLSPSKEDLTKMDNNLHFRKPSNAKKLVKTRSFDTGSIAIENISDDILFGNSDQKSSSSSSSNSANQLEKEKTNETQGDVSPVYEEPEDFATTIAKLRSLLQQRESSSTLSDKSVQSIDSQHGNQSMEKSDTNNKLQSMEGDNLSFDSQVACDVPNDGRLFMNVCIPKTELNTDPNGSPYVLYYIQYDGIYMMDNPEAEPELVLQTTVTKRRFQEFLNLQTRFEENNQLKAAMKGIKGPSKWLNLPFGGKTDESTTASRRAVLELYLQQLCSKAEISASPELHEFLAYGYNESSAFVKKDSDSSIQRIDKILAHKMTGVFNSIKTVLPSFDFETPAVIATNDTVKSFQEQKLLQGFLNFGNKSESFEIKLDFLIKEPTGESLTDDIRRYFSEKSDCIEDALDVLDSTDWLSEQGECRPVSSDGKCVWHNYKDLLLDDYAKFRDLKDWAKSRLEDELEQLDSWLPVYSLVLDILCELLQDADSWATKEPIVHLVKILSGHWESRIQEEIKKLDWDQIMGNLIRLIRLVVFQSSASDETVDLKQEETKTVLQDVLLSIMPKFLARFVKTEGVISAVSLFIDSFQHFRPNRDVLLRLMDILLVQLLSCPHLTCDAS